MYYVLCILDHFFTSNPMLEAVYCSPVSHGPPWRVPGGKEVITSLKTEEKHQRQGEIPPSLFFSYFVSKLRLEMNSCHFMAPNYNLQVTPIECPTGSLENSIQPLTLNYWWKNYREYIIIVSSVSLFPFMCFFHVLMEARIETLPPLGLSPGLSATVMMVPWDLRQSIIFITWEKSDWKLIDSCITLSLI